MGADSGSSHSPSSAMCLSVTLPAGSPTEAPASTGRQPSSTRVRLSPPLSLLNNAPVHTADDVTPWNSAHRHWKKNVTPKLCSFSEISLLSCIFLNVSMYCEVLKKKKKLNNLLIFTRFSHCNFFFFYICDQIDYIRLIYWFPKGSFSFH